MNDTCPTCGGEKEEGTTTFTTDQDFGVVVVRNVPASVCRQCGDDWIGPEVAKKIEEIVEEAREKKSQIEMLPYPA